MRYASKRKMSADACRMKAHTDSPEHKIVMAWWSQQIEEQKKVALDAIETDETLEISKIAKRAQVKYKDWQELKENFETFLLNYMQE